MGRQIKGTVSGEESGSGGAHVNERMRKMRARKAATLKAETIERARKAGKWRGRRWSGGELVEAALAHPPAVIGVDTPYADVREEINALQVAKRMIMESIGTEVIEKANLPQRAVAYGIFVDKERLMRGEATMIIGQKNRENSEELAEKLVQELERRGIKRPAPGQSGIAYDPEHESVVDGECEEIEEGSEK